jgi:hypothetical protein
VKIIIWISFLATDITGDDIILPESTADKVRIQTVITSAL